MGFRFGVSGVRRDRLVALVTAFSGAALVAWLWAYNMGADGTGGAWDYYDTFIVGNILALFFLPIVVIIAMGEEPSDFGLAFADSRSVRLTAALLYIGLLVLLVPMSRVERFQDYYPLFKQFNHYPIFDRYMHVHSFGEFAEHSIKALIYGWVSYGLYMFCWEFFFRGYLLFGMARTIGWSAVLVQSIAFGLLHWRKPMPEFLASFPAGIILGFLALKAKSFLPGFVLHWAAVITFDILVLLASKG